MVEGPQPSEQSIHVLEMLEALTQVNTWLQSSFQEQFKVGIGIHLRDNLSCDLIKKKNLRPGHGQYCLTNWRIDKTHPQIITFFFCSS